MIRRFGDRPITGQKYIMRPGTYAILPLEHQLLLTHQANPEPEIQLPGGGIDPGENPLHALHREVFEETGWHIARPRKLGAYRRFIYMPEYDLWAEKLCHIYIARPTMQVSEPTETDHTCVWLSREDALKKLQNDGDRLFVDIHIVSKF
ncbi:MAG TPA: NUDIX hydrolase [Rhodobacteraceae bacterium]|jgi:8-oxo-dGTP diphosphatase|nr:NUDIX hydrolase [Alphaproteobacteria bacterium]HAB36568.1 NUDIX hydrolase [Paracoccaceae bacterium]